MFIKGGDRRCFAIPSLGVVLERVEVRQAICWQKSSTGREDQLSLSPSFFDSIYSRGGTQHSVKRVPYSEVHPKILAQVVKFGTK